MARCAPAPDWDNVPFEVGCPRCAHDLKGRSLPKCPACELEFDWSVVVPIDQLTCLSCGYHLYGLPEPRCPECGRPFTWQEVLIDFRCRGKPLFEFQWCKQPIRSFVGTWCRALQPKRLWTTVELHDPVRLWPILILCAAFVVAFLGTVILADATDWWLLEHRFGGRAGSPGPGIGGWLRLIARFSLSSEPYLLGLSVVVWLLSCLGALLIFRQTMRRCKVRIVHVVRVWAHTAPIVIPIVPIVFLVYRWGGTLLYYPPRIELPFGAVVLGAIGFAMGALYSGYRRYLQMPHSLGIAICSQIIAVLAVGAFEMKFPRGAGGSVLVQALSSLSLW